MSSSSFLFSRSGSVANNSEPAHNRTSSTTLQGNGRVWARAVLVGISYYVGTLVGFALTPTGQPNSGFWPPNAILLAALLLAPRRAWWTFFVLVFPAHMFAQLHTGVPLWTVVSWFLTNSAEALFGAFCIRALNRRECTFDSVRGVLIFVIFGVLLAPFLTSFLDAAAVVVTGWGRHYWPLSTERFWTNALATLTLVPGIVLCVSRAPSWIRKATPAKYWEAALLLLVTALITFVVFGLNLASPATAPALLYAPLPLLIYAAVRFGPCGLSLCLLCIALISITYLIQGHQPFPYASLEQNILSVQILLCLEAVPLLVLSVLMRQARQTEETLRNVSGSLIDAQEQERRRIAREIHDNLGQEIAMAQLKLEEIGEEPVDLLKPNLADLSAQLRTISRAAREISHDLYPTQLELLGLESAVGKLCREIERGGELAVQLSMSSLPTQLLPSVSLCLYRVAQEALHNVMKHSHASTVDVQLGSDQGQVLLRIADDGIGFDARHEGAGLGLHNMRERVRSVNGIIEITSSPKHGTRIEVHVTPTCDVSGMRGAA